MRNITPPAVIIAIIISGILVGSAARSLGKKSDAVDTAITELEVLTRTIAEQHTALMFTCEQLSSNDTAMAAAVSHVARGSMDNRRIIMHFEAIFVEYYGIKKWQRMISDAPAPATPKE